MNENTVLLNRRSFLYGAGIALALPRFETFAAESPGANNTPKRFVSVYHPDGVGLPLKADPAWKDWSWFPRGGERDFELTKVLDVLEPLRSEITIYSGLSHPAVRQVHGHSNADQYLTAAATGGHGPRVCDAGFVVVRQHDHPLNAGGSQLLGVDSSLPVVFHIILRKADHIFV